MSHLGDRLSALIDGELSHEERDRLHAHLAACEQCRAEAAALRALKRRVAALGDIAINPRLARRLFALAEPDGPVPQRPRRSRGSRGSRGPRPALHMYPDTRTWQDRQPAGLQPSDRPRGDRPPGRPRYDGPAPGRPPRSRRRVRYLAAGLGSFLIVAIGGLSFFAGGTQATPAPTITPPVGMFTVEHSVTTGEVPFVNPTASFLTAHPAGRSAP